MKKLNIVLLLSTSFSVTHTRVTMRPTLQRPSSLTIASKELKKLIESNNTSQQDIVTYFDTIYFPMIQSEKSIPHDLLKQFFNKFYNINYVPGKIVLGSSQPLADLISNFQTRIPTVAQQPNFQSTMPVWYESVLQQLMQGIGAHDITQMTEKEAQDRIQDWIDASERLKRDNKELLKKLDEVLKRNISSLRSSSLPLTDKERSQALSSLDLSRLSVVDQQIVADAALAKAGGDRQIIQPLVTNAEEQGIVPPPPPPPLPGMGIPLPPPMPGGLFSPTNSGNLNQDIPLVIETIKEPTLDDIIKNYANLIKEFAQFFKSNASLTDSKGANSAATDLAAKLSSLQRTIINKLTELQGKSDLTDYEQQWKQQVEEYLPSINFIFTINKQWMVKPCDIIKVIETFDSDNEFVRQWNDILDKLVQDKMNIVHADNKIEKIREELRRAQNMSATRDQQEEIQKRLNAAKTDRDKKYKKLSNFEKNPLNQQQIRDIMQVFQTYLNSAALKAMQRESLQEVHQAFAQGQAAYKDLNAELNQMCDNVQKGFDSLYTDFTTWQLTVLPKGQVSQVFTVDMVAFLNPFNKIRYQKFEQNFKDGYKAAEVKINKDALQEKVYRKLLLDKMQDALKISLSNLVYKVMALQLQKALEAGIKLDDESPESIKTAIQKFIMGVSSIQSVDPAETKIVMGWYTVWIQKSAFNSQTSAVDTGSSSSDVIDSPYSKTRILFKDYLTKYQGLSLVKYATPDMPQLRDFVRSNIFPMMQISILETFVAFQEDYNTVADKNFMALGIPFKEVKLIGSEAGYKLYSKNEKGYYTIYMFAPRVMNPETDILITRDSNNKHKYVLNTDVITPQKIQGTETLTKLLIMGWRLGLIKKDEIESQLQNPTLDKNAFKDHLIQELNNRDDSSEPYAWYLLYDKGMEPATPFKEQIYKDLIKKLPSQATQTVLEATPYFDSDDINFMAQAFIKTLTDITLITALKNISVHDYEKVNLLVGPAQVAKFISTFDHTLIPEHGAYNFVQEQQKFSKADVQLQKNIIDQFYHALLYNVHFRHLEDVPTDITSID